MPDINTPPICSECQSPMALREKNGEKFWGCPNWKSCGGKTRPYGKSAPRTFQKPASSPPTKEDAITWLKKIYEKVEEIEENTHKNSYDA